MPTAEVPAHVWVDGAGREWPLDDHMWRRIHRTRNWVCEVCQVPVTLFDIVTEVACLPRINGDSKYGYEAFHLECLDRFNIGVQS